MKKSEDRKSYRLKLSRRSRSSNSMKMMIVYMMMMKKMRVIRVHKSSMKKVSKRVR